ncbi:MAG TPA: hypothetical protein VJ843_01400 [Candidatus Saccharimonadales bacterium]|nr:hypothetical protein [Candidatus Saccharimonadales bacterium]
MTAYSLAKRCIAFLGSRIFFIGVMLVFLVQALWLALSALYPMAFDEEVHFGIINIYAHQWSPFLAGQPAGADSFGAIARDPSYLYHYLMSFPYRALEHLTSNMTVQIVALRFINIALFAAGLLVFRRVLLRLTKSSPFTHLALAVFILIPIVPQLAAHINYDNLLFLLVGWCVLLTTDIHRQFAAGRVELRSIGALAVLSLFTSIVKYSFLPILLALIVFLIYDAWRSFRGNAPGLTAAIGKNWRTIGTRARVGFVVLFIVSGGLFFQRFGVNLLRYHTPVPACDQVLTFEHCSLYGPWIRDYNYSLDQLQADPNPLRYTASWFYGLWYRMFFAINSKARDYQNFAPLPLPAGAMALLAGSSFVLILVFARRIFAQPLFVMCGLVLIFYCGALWFDNFKAYRHTGEEVAVNGRYLLVILPLAMALAWRAWSYALARASTWVKPAIAAAVLLLFLQGGGAMTFILRSDASWDWSNHRVVQANDLARKIIAPVVVEGKKDKYGL